MDAENQEEFKDSLQRICRPENKSYDERSSELRGKAVNQFDCGPSPSTERGVG